MKLLRLRDLVERRAHLGAMDTILVEEDAAEDGIDQGGASLVVRGHVEPTDIGRKPDAPLKDFSGGRHYSGGLCRVRFQARAFLAKLVEPFTGLVLRQAVLGKVDEALLALVEIGQPLLERRMQLAERSLFIGDGASDAVDDRLDEVIGHVQRSIVADHVILNEARR